MSRADFLIYGRYIDPAAVVLAAIGAVALISRIRRVSAVVLPWSLGLLLGLGILVKFARDDIGETRLPLFGPVVAGVEAWPFDRSGLDVVRWTLTALVAGVAIIVAARFGKRAAAGALMVLLMLSTITGTERAVSEHNAWNNSILYDNYPAAPDDFRRVAVAQDTLGISSYKFGFPAQQYVLAPLGWTFAVEPMDSDRLAAAPPEDAGMVVTRFDAGPPEGEWCHMPNFTQIQVWLRLGSVAKGVDDMDCFIAQP